jgi:hypothetical protein
MLSFLGRTRILFFFPWPNGEATNGMEWKLFRVEEPERGLAHVPSGLPLPLPSKVVSGIVFIVAGTTARTCGYEYIWFSFFNYFLRM